MYESFLNRRFDATITVETNTNVESESCYPPSRIGPAPPSAGARFANVGRATPPPPAPPAPRCKVAELLQQFRARVG